jgi:hypothetical protein
MTADSGDSAPPAGRRPSVGRAVAVYTGMRLVLFLVAFLLASLLIDELLLAFAAGFLASAVLSIPLLAPYRRAVNEATAARAARRVDGGADEPDEAGRGSA